MLGRGARRTVILSPSRYSAPQASKFPGDRLNRHLVFIPLSYQTTSRIYRPSASSECTKFLQHGVRRATI